LFYKIVSDFTYDGLGSIFGGLFKAAMPLLKKGAKTPGREALKTGSNIAGDVVSLILSVFPYSPSLPRLLQARRRKLAIV
jgi:hypothetical protein